MTTLDFDESTITPAKVQEFLAQFDPSDLPLPLRYDTFPVEGGSDGKWSVRGVEFDALDKAEAFSQLLSLYREVCLDPVSFEGIGQRSLAV